MSGSVRRGAISELIRERGFVETGRSGNIRFVQGSLNVGEAMSPPIIKAAKSAAPPVDLVILDAPPGTSCPVITTVQGCDAVILVTEPTPFGMHDLKLAVDMIRVLKLPFGVVINRMDADEVGARDFCRQNDIPLLAEIPDDRRIAEAYSRGRMICEALPEYASLFMKLLDESLKLSRSTVG